MVPCILTKVNPFEIMVLKPKITHAHSLCCCQWVMVEERHGENHVDGLALGKIHRFQFFLVVAEVKAALLVDLRHINTLHV